MFDRYLHTYGSFSFALLAYSLVLNLFVTGGSKAYQSLFVFTIGMALGAIFELIEARSDWKKGSNNQRGLQDTNMDMLGDLIGSLLAGVCVSGSVLKGKDNAVRHRDIFHGVCVIVPYSHRKFCTIMKRNGNTLEIGAFYNMIVRHEYDVMPIL